MTAQAGLRAVNDSLNDSLTSSWSEIQSRFESVEAERHAAVSAAASATSMLADLEQRERKAHDPCGGRGLKRPNIWAVLLLRSCFRSPYKSRTILAEIFFLVSSTFGLRF